MSTHKIFSQPEKLVDELTPRRERGERVVFANGCFELVHVGHIRYLQEARSLGHILIVAVNTDASMRLVKPDRRPVNPDEERMEILAALECVDYVVPLREQTPESLLALLRPEIHTKGTDYTIDRIPERGVVESYGGKICLVGGPKVRNTSDMLREIKDRDANP